MRRISQALTVLILTITITLFFSAPTIAEAGWLGSVTLSGRTLSSSLLVPVKKKKNKRNDHQNESGDIGEGERSCPEGYVVLKEKNKYGAFCEPKEGFPEAEQKCQFPGQVGKPPNCACPGGTEFVGYKGCVKVTKKEWCELVSYVGGIEPFYLKCQGMGGKAYPSPIQKKAEPGVEHKVTECCTIQYYEK